MLLLILDYSLLAAQFGINGRNLHHSTAFQAPSYISNWTFRKESGRQKFQIFLYGENLQLTLFCLCNSGQFRNLKLNTFTEWH